MVWEKTPSLIICASELPDLDSFQLVSQLRYHSAIATIPIIMLSARTDLAEWRKAIEMGADDYLGSPVKAAQLKGAIATQIRKQLAFEAKAQVELERLRQSITCSLPHELRTVLTGILTSSDLLNSELECLDLSTIRKLLSCIQLSGKRLSRMVQNYLFYLELEAIRTNPQEIQRLQSNYTYSIVDLLRYVADKKYKQSNREADLILELQDASVKIEQNHLLKLAEEILDNAVKFSEPGTPIKVNTSKEKDNLVLSISDRGRGMTPEQINQIGAYMQFERQVYEQQGSGLGLAIVKHLTEIYAGKLIVESTPNQETTVKIYLPTANLYLNNDGDRSLNLKVA
jgi:signal transduction histidine kinase